MLVEINVAETGVDKPSRPVVNDATALVESRDVAVVTMVLPGPVAVAPAPLTFKLVTRVIGVGKPSEPIDVDTEVIIGKTGVVRPS